VRRWALALVVLAWAAPLAAQQPAESGSELTIYLMTMGPGAAIWERFGHNAIVVEDAARGTSRAYNYGMFDFAQKDFIPRFLQGRMLYWMEDFDALQTVRSYQRHGRSVWVQELNLTPGQRRDLRDFLAWNDQDENRYYRYDYYRDNCSTRVRDAIDLVLGGAIRARTDTVPTGTTYRWHTDRLTAADPLAYTGINMALGQPVDRPISAWQETFLPLELQKWVRQVRVPGPGGVPQPLVKSERALYESSAFTDRASPPRWFGRFLLLGLVTGAIMAGLACRAGRSVSAQRGFQFLATGWALLTGLGGIVLASLWIFTDHTATHYNENVLQLSVLALPLAALIPLARRGYGRFAVAIAMLVAGLSVLGVVLKLLPGFGQQNAQVLALCVPINLAVGFGVWCLRRDAWERSLVRKGVVA
jgi:hypothetical protein